jgi:long-chain acyl-CoA synthetase
MPRRETLLDFFRDHSRSSKEFLIYDDGARSWRYTYAQVAGAAAAFARRLRDHAIAPGDKVILWSENRPEWIVVLWGCLLEGVTLVPIDYRASSDMLLRVHEIVHAKAVLVGEQVPELAIDIPLWKLDGWDWTPAPLEIRANASRDELAEIIFTSGATSQPKGVTITHRNVLANIVPVENEVAKYRKYARPFSPIRFLNLLPLSHLFGQAMAAFIPPMLEGTVIFLHGYNPREIVRQIKNRRISLLVAVPKILEVLREHLLQLDPSLANPAPPGLKWWQRWWHYRHIHNLFGWKFWAFIVGAAPLPPDLEEFFSKLGFLVIQGYGLTETAPIVTLNHPLHARKGTVGKPIAGVEVKIAEDGEILVRGENVTMGYYGQQAETGAFETNSSGERWLHTGDIGGFDSEGRLHVRGRKKEMIVTPEGLNIFPEDVEQVLNRLPGVRDSAAVGRDRVHAVLLLEPGMDPQSVIRQANQNLEDHQKIRGFSVWTAESLPRTEGTAKLKRGEILKWVEEGGAAPEVRRAGSDAEKVLAKLAAGRAITPSTSLDELGLSSLERVELMVALDLDESQMSSARTVADLAAPKVSKTTEESLEPQDWPHWARSWWARAFRRAFLPVVVFSLTRLFAWAKVEGREHLRDLRGPVIFAPNHQSYMDTPAIMLALPVSYRYRVVPTMSKNFFEAHFDPAGFSLAKRLRNSLAYYLSTLVFHAFALPQKQSGQADALRYAGDLVSEGYSILIFPEGQHTETGEIRPFRAGVGMMAAKLDVPVVPIRIEGFDRVLHRTWKMARPGRVRIRFGKPILLRGDNYAALAREVEDAVRSL